MPLGYTLPPLTKKLEDSSLRTWNKGSKSKNSKNMDKLDFLTSLMKIIFGYKKQKHWGLH